MEFLGAFFGFVAGKKAAQEDPKAVTKTLEKFYAEEGPQRRII